MKKINKASKAKKPAVKVRDLQPKKDARGGGVRYPRGKGDGG